MFSVPAWMPGRELRQGDGDDVAEEGAAAHGRSQDPNGSLANRQQRPFGPHRGGNVLSHLPYDARRMRTGVPCACPGVDARVTDPL